MDARRPILTPCRNVCVVDPAARLCVGCGRTLDEIAGWLGLSQAEREAIMRLLPARLESLAAPDREQVKA